MDKIKALRELSFGHRIAEDEVVSLSRYFVRTEQWRRLREGSIDVVYGQKGTGKSALYSALYQQKEELRAEDMTHLIVAEQIRGAPAFRVLFETEALDEAEFHRLWKLYLLQLLGVAFREMDLASEGARVLVRTLEDGGLLPREGGLVGLLRSAVQHLRQLIKWEGVSTGVEFDKLTGLPSGVSAKITFREPDAASKAHGFLSVDSLLQGADAALSEAGRTVWILLDRLDVAFAENEELECNGLRALFRLYLDLRGFEHMALKIFLRADIWDLLMAKGFREASHITRTTTISWGRNSLLHLILRRILQSQGVAEYLNIDPEAVLRDLELQEQVFHRIFPKTMTWEGATVPTFEWVLAATQDGSASNTPRELIHLLSEARQAQIRHVEIGGAFELGDALCNAFALEEALREVSRFRLEQSFLTEYPQYRKQVLQLRNAAALHSSASLMKIWGVSESWAVSIAEDLFTKGLFRRGETDEGTFYIIAPVYRPALGGREEAGAGTPT